MSIPRAAARAVVSRAIGRDPQRLRRRLHVVEDWQERDGEEPARLGPRETISVTRVGHWRQVDPRVTAEGWRDIGRWLGVLGWAAAIGAAWWLGSSRGRGPLAGARRR